MNTLNKTQLRELEFLSTLATLMIKWKSDIDEIKRELVVLNKKDPEILH